MANILHEGSLPKDDGLRRQRLVPQSHSRCWRSPAKSPGTLFLEFGTSYQEIAFLAPTRVRIGSSCNLDCKPLNLSTLLYHRLWLMSITKSQNQETVVPPWDEKSFILGKRAMSSHACYCNCSPVHSVEQRWFELQSQQEVLAIWRAAQDLGMEQRDRARKLCFVDQRDRNLEPDVRCRDRGNRRMASNAPPADKFNAVANSRNSSPFSLFARVKKGTEIGRRSHFRRSVLISCCGAN